MTNRRGFVFCGKPERLQGCGIQTSPRYCTWAELGELLLRDGVCRGGNVREPYQAIGRLEVKLALEIATQVAAGLAAVHEQNLVHRDIKPTNIMVKLKEGRL